MRNEFLDHLDKAIGFLQEARQMASTDPTALAQRLGLEGADYDALTQRLIQHVSSILSTGSLSHDLPQLDLAPGVDAVVVGGKIRVRVPYYPPILAELRKFGRWDADARQWIFDLQDLGRLRDLLQEHFGKPGEPGVTLRMRVGGKQRAIYALGRLILERPARDSRVKRGPGVVIVEGELPNRGGSRKYPHIGGYAVVEVRGVPLSLARRFVETQGEQFEAEIIE